jgi:Ni/Fe-hydrogenase 1 B-type cytochrome subunit
MRIIRFVHIVAAYVFVASGIVRTYWLFAGNQFSRWSAFIPTNRRHLRELVDQTRFYLFLRKDLPGILGHNALASGTYTVVFFLFLIQTATGFALVGMHGTQPWAALLGWLPGLLGGEQGIRLVHHLLMWAILAFAIHHVYSALLVDHIERSGLLSSIFTGSKFVARWRVIEARDGGIAFDALVRDQDVEESRAEALAQALRGDE